MKKSLVTALFVLVCTLSFGQKIRFSDSTNQWNYIYISSGIIPPLAWPFSDYYIRDTVIHGIAYKQLWTNEIYGIAYIREDTVSRKVFAIWPSSTFDTLEKILYDFSIGIGDTFRNSHDTYFVYNIDSVTIRSNWYKTWHLHNVNSPSDDFEVIDGLGCTYQPCFPILPLPGTFEGGDILTCFSNHGTNPAIFPKIGPYYLDVGPFPFYFDNDSSCTVNFLDIRNIGTMSNTTTIFPNPTTESSKVTLSSTFLSGTLTILSSMGQIIYSQCFQNKNELQIGDKIKYPGVYFYRVEDNKTGEVSSGKFVTQ